LRKFRTSIRFPRTKVLCEKGHRLSYYTCIRSGFPQHNGNCFWYNLQSMIIYKDSHLQGAGGMTQEVECLLRMHEVLSSNPSTAKRR
jgi:hypothetical protein